MTADYSRNLQVVPCTLREARAFVAKHHRHSGPPRGHRASVSLERDGERLGVAILGRPVARALQSPRTAEILRVCVIEESMLENGHAFPGCSMLYGACRKLWRAWGGNRLVTYALESESGASLRAAGFVRVVRVDPEPGGWGREDRPRENAAIYATPKWRWEWNA